MKFSVIFLIFLLKIVTSSTTTLPFTTLLENPTTAKIQENQARFDCSTSNPKAQNQECTLSHFNLSSKDSIALLNVDGLKKFSKAHTLNIENSKVSEIPLDLAQVLTKVFTEVENLNFSGIGLTKINQEVLKKFPKLKTLDLSKNGLEKIDADLFDENSELREIDLSGNAIKTIKTKSLRNLKKLNTLNLKGNKCIDEKFEKFSKNERERQKNMNLVMVKCRGGDEQKKKREESGSSIMDFIQPVKTSMDTISKTFGF